MTITLTREEAQQVLNAMMPAFDGVNYTQFAPDLGQAIETLRARLSAPEPDAPTPRDQYCYERGYQRALEVIRQTPQREWQGLTDEDRQELAAEQYGWEGLCSAVEAKLREKNA